MQKNYTNSRSVVMDRNYKKTIEQHYDNHIKKLDQIKKRRSDFSNYGQEHEQFMKKKYGQKQKVTKIQQEFNPQHNQVKSLIKHIAGIVQRKNSEGILKNRGGSVSEHKLYRNKQIDFEKRQIQRTNQILNKRIAQHKNSKLTKKDLKKQFKTYQSQRNLLRKVRYEEKSKKKKEKTIQFDKDHID